MKKKFVFVLVIGILILSSCVISDQYTIQFDSQGGSLVESLSLDMDDIITLPTPTKEGYQFLGWTLSIDNIEIITLENLTKEDMTLYAIWVAINQSFEVNYYLNKDELYIKNTFEAIDVFVLPDEPTKTGYTFIGWYKDELLGIPFDESVIDGTNLMLYAKFEPMMINIWSFKVIENNETSLTIALSIEGEVNFIGFNANISFNETALEIIQVSNTLSITKNQMLQNMLFNYVDAINIINNDVNVLEITFKKLSDADFDIELEIIEMITRDENYNIYEVDYRVIAFDPTT